MMMKEDHRACLVLLYLSLKIQKRIKFRDLHPEELMSIQREPKGQEYVAAANQIDMKASSAVVKWAFLVCSISSKLFISVLASGRLVLSSERLK